MIKCDIIFESQRSGCGAAGSALPWGGRGRKFKSCHSDQEEIRKNLLFSFVFSQNLSKPRVFVIYIMGLFFPALRVEQAHFSHLTTCLTTCGDFCLILGCFSIVLRFYICLFNLLQIVSVHLRLMIHMGILLQDYHPPKKPNIDPQLHFEM